MKFLGGLCFMFGSASHWALIVFFLLRDGGFDYPIGLVEFRMADIHIPWLEAPESWQGLRFLVILGLAFFGPLGLFGLPFFVNIMATNEI